MARLSINSEMFDSMRDQFDTILNSIVKLLEEGDEGEITVKVGVDKGHLMDEVDKNGEPVEKKKISVDWKIERVIKAKKYKVEGWSVGDFFLEENEEGELNIVKVEQVSLFDNQGKKAVEMRR